MVRKLRPLPTHHSFFLGPCLWKTGKSNFKTVHYGSNRSFLWPLAKVGLLSNGSKNEGFIQLTAGSHCSVILFARLVSYNSVSLILHLSLGFSENITCTRFSCVSRFLRRLEVPNVFYVAMVLSLSFICHEGFVSHSSVFSYQIPLHNLSYPSVNPVPNRAINLELCCSVQ